MLVATWNVNGLRARLDFVRHWLLARRPDVVGLQELKLPDEQFPHAELEELGYRAVVHAQKSWNGVAVLSRLPAEPVCRGLPGGEDQGARLVTARVEGADGAWSFVTVYCPNGKSTSHQDFPRKLAWFDALAEHLEREHDPTEPLVVCGDFNVCPGALDSWNEEALAGRIFHTDEERARLRRLLDWGLVDVYRRVHPERRMFSWWDYRAGAFHQNHGLRIDLVLATEPLSRSVASAEIDRDYRKKKEGLVASDHAPVLVELR
ncbi:MAG TPA: exodeoxyribonuclease III [Thermoanaerobaculia bacterium]|nr:exodeoxyribonuclease III [Thermoanaerobaculia bacterium]